MSRADIKEHECWFVELLRLQERRREAIAEWRDAKAGRITGDNNTMIIESTVNQQQSVEDEEAVKNALVDSSPSKEPTAAEKVCLMHGAHDNIHFI
jgi:hypothetical protein